MLGIDRAAEHEATRTAASVGVGPEVVALRRAGGLARDAVHRGGDPARRGAAGARAARAGRCARCARSTPARRSRAASTRSRSSRRTATPRSRAARCCPTGSPRRTRRPRASRALRAARDADGRATTTSSTRTSSTTGSDCGSSTGSTRGWATPSSTSRTSRSTTSSTRRGANALLAAYSARRASGPRALDLMRFMSDFREAMWGVVQSVVSELDFDFDALRGGALRAHAADGGGAGLPRRARALTRVRAQRLVHSHKRCLAARPLRPGRPRAAGCTRRSPRAARAPPRCPSAPAP